MSRTFCPYPIVGAIAKADDFLGPDRIWHTVAEGQPNFADHHRFLGNYLTALREHIDIPEMESIADRDHEVINEFMAQRGFDITLDPFVEGQFGTASVLDITVKWLAKGLRAEVTHAKRSFDAVHLKPGVVIFKTRQFPLVASIETRSGDIVNMAPLSQGLPTQVPDDMALMDWIMSSSDSLPSYDYEGVIFPMVDLEDKPDISWVQNLWTMSDAKRRWEISQALQQTFFKMNEFGARTKSGVSMGFRTTAAREPKPPLVIDEPFVLWKHRPGLPTPFFAAYITPDDWKDPGSLGDTDDEEE